MSRAFEWRRMPAIRAVALAALAFLYLPLFVLIVLSFNSNRVALIWGGFSSRWFAVALGNPDLLRTAENSLVVALVATIVSTLLALPAALALERGGVFRGRAAGEALIVLPLVAPEIVTAVSTLVLFEAIGLHGGLGNVMLAHIAFCLPFAILPMRARLRDLGSDMEDAARDLYAGAWRTFRLVTLPLMAPAVIAGATLAFVTSLDDFLITLMVAPAGATTLPVYLYGMLRLGVTPEANAAATLLLLASVAAVCLAQLFGARRVAPKTMTSWPPA